MSYRINKVCAIQYSSWFPSSHHWLLCPSFDSRQVPSHILCVIQQYWIIYNLLNANSHLRLCSCCYLCLEDLSSLFTLLILIHLSQSSSGVTSCFFQDGFRYPILLYISIRVISTLNQFIFLFKTKLHALRGCCYITVFLLL